MVRRASLMLAVSVVTSSLAIGCGDDSCPEPTLAQCQDPLWLETDTCGKGALEEMRTSAEATCSRLLIEHSKQLTAGYAEEEDVLPPELGGGVGLVTVVPNAEQGLSEINMSLTHVGSAQQAAASATAGGLSAQEQALREQWNANGNRIESCREYVYEKYYDYSLFEDAVVSHHSDTRYIAEVVFGPSTEVSAIGSRLASSPPKMKDGNALSSFPRTVKAPLPGYLVDIPPVSDGGSGATILTENVFAALPQELLQPGEWEQYEWVAPKTEVNTFESCSSPELEGGWLWHRTRREELQAQGYSPAELDALYLKVREFQQLMKAYRDYKVAGTPNCCSSAPAEECCTLHQATGSSLETRLRELFDLAVAEGCMEPGSTRCSWSPAFLVDSLRTTENFRCYHDMVLGSFGAAMELDYQACLALTNDDFTQLSAFEFQLPDGQSWPPASECPQYEGNDWPTCPVGDYSASPAAFDLFVSRQQSYQQAVQAYWQAMLAAMPPDVFDRQGKLKVPALEWSDQHDAGNAKFGVFYDYHLGWELPGVTTTAQTIPELCLVGPEAVGSFTAGGWAFGSERVNAIDAYFKAGLVQDQIEGHLEILGVRFWVPQGATAVDLLVNSEISLSCGIVRPCLPEKQEKENKEAERCPLRFPFTVAGWPMSLEAGIAGSLGLEPVWEASKATAHTRGASCWSFRAGFKPTLGLQAFGALNALDIKVLKAGLSLSVTLIELGLPITWQISETSEVDSVTDHETLRLEVGSGGALAIRLLAGRIAAFLSVGIRPFSVSYSYNIFKWDGIKLPELPLWGSSYSVPLWELLELMRQSP